MNAIPPKKCEFISLPLPDQFTFLAIDVYNVPHTHNLHILLWYSSFWNNAFLFEMLSISIGGHCCERCDASTCTVCCTIWSLFLFLSILTPFNLSFLAASQTIRFNLSVFESVWTLREKSGRVSCYCQTLFLNYSTQLT